MERTPKSLRVHIGLFGRTNVGKSSLLNLIAGQDVAITSPLAGTTTDVVEKSMELLPFGPVLFLDTAGLNDTSCLSALRVKKSIKVLDRAEVVLLIVEPNEWTEYEESVVSAAQKRGLPCIVAVNKIDQACPKEDFLKKIINKAQGYFLCSSIDYAHRDDYVRAFKKILMDTCPPDSRKLPSLLDGVLPKGGLAALIVPIDKEAPAGRLILPQVQAIRASLDSDAVVLVVKEREYTHALSLFKKKPDLVVCDSQVVLRMVEETPRDIACTTFSILFSRYKGDLLESVRAVAALKSLSPHDKVLIAEACSHHAIEDDIGRIKIPYWLREKLRFAVDIDVCSGRDYPENLNAYKVVIHCGGCMLTRREMLFRLHKAKSEGSAVTNYGVCIAYLQGVLERVLSPFPQALEVLASIESKAQGQAVATEA